MAEEQSVFRRCPSLLSLTLMSVLLSPLSLQAADNGTWTDTVMMKSSLRR